ncbi:MAG: serine/threonine protein kinase [Deltaproteobacteria bacterium]|nr:serine/threonine protein kinase [Deltaproteobacteria bacterium]
MKTFGRYQLLRRIAAGGMAEVFLATGPNPNNAELIALKLIHAHIAEDESFQAMFLDEARLTAPLSHPNLVQIFDLGRSENRLYLAMEYIRGYPLHLVSQRAESRGGIGPARAAAMVKQAALGLHHAHEARDSTGALLNLVHRDVSPHNLLLDQEGVIKVVDFGVAKARGQIATSTKGGLKGKAGYSSPEQLRSEGIDRRADVFALGAVLFELALAEPLIPGRSEAEILQRMLFEPMRDLRSIPDLPPALAKLIGKCVAPKPQDRFSSALELADALSEYLGSNGPGRTQLAQLMGLLYDPLPTTAAEALADAQLPALRTAAIIEAAPRPKPDSTSAAAARMSTDPAQLALDPDMTGPRSLPPPPIADDEGEVTQAMSSSLFDDEARTIAGGKPPAPRKLPIPPEPITDSGPNKKLPFPVEPITDSGPMRRQPLLDRTVPERKRKLDLDVEPTSLDRKAIAHDPDEDTSTTTTTNPNDNSTHTDTRPQKPPRRPGERRPPVVLYALGGGAVLLVAALGYLLLREPKPKAPEREPVATAVVDSGPPPEIAAMRPPPAVADAGGRPQEITLPDLEPTPHNRATGTLTVISSPWAEVKLDGRELGQTPLHNKVVPAGHHKLELTNPDEKLHKTVNINVVAHRQNEERIKLAP